jgi:type I restriction enzyme, S subunit
MTATASHETWSRRRLRFDARLNPVKSELKLPNDAEVSFVPMDAVGELGGLRLDEQRTVDEVYNGYTYFQDGDVVVAKITPCFENGKGALAAGLTNQVGFGTTELHVLRPNETLDERFLFYITMARDFRCYGTAEMFGAGGQKRVPERFLRDWRPPMPSIETQRRIIAFLDEKTAQIDGLIAKKQALLDRFAEKRHAVIARAVIQGLRPTAPMKDSGVDWLGHIPTHWKVKRVKHIAKLESGHTPDKKIEEYWENGNIPWVSLNDTAEIRANDYISDTKFKTNALGIANSSARLLPARAVVFTRDATIGETAITTRPMAVSQHLIAWICDQSIIVPEYLLLLTYAMKGELLRLTNGATIGTIGLGDVKELRVCIPPIEEQTAIVKSVFALKEHIDQVSRLVEASQERMLEYRSSLITAAITGQIEGLR